MSVRTSRDGVLRQALTSECAAMNCFRMVDAYVIHRNDPGGPAFHIAALAPWDHVFKDTLYATQETVYS